MSSFDNINVNLTPSEENAFSLLWSMFESVPADKIVTLIHKHNSDLDKCIDELISLPPPATSVNNTTDSSSITGKVDFNLPSGQVESKPLLPVKLPQKVKNQLRVEQREEREKERQKKLLEKSKKLDEQLRKRAERIQLKEQKALEKPLKKKPSTNNNSLDIAFQMAEDSLDGNSSSVNPRDPITQQKVRLVPATIVADSIGTQPAQLPEFDSSNFPPLPKSVPSIVNTITDTTPVMIPNDSNNNNTSPLEDSQSTPVDTTPVLTPTTIPSEREELLIQRIKELEEKNLLLDNENKKLIDDNNRLMNSNKELSADNIRIDNEKRNGMKWIIQQMDALKGQIQPKDDKINELSAEITKLQQLLEESKIQENKLEKLLNHSKEVFIDGVTTLSKNVSRATEKGWSKVQNELLNNDKDFQIIEKMREFARTLKEELNNLVFFDDKQRKNNSLPTSTTTSSINNNSNDNSTTVESKTSDSVSDGEEEGLSEQERADIQRAKLESLQSYIIS